MPKGGGEGPKGPTWKSFKSPEEIARLNEEATKEPELSELLGERSREQLLEGIDKDLIPATRKKAEAILAVTEDADRAQAKTQVEIMMAKNPPKGMLVTILQETEDDRLLFPVWYAATAMAFLSLTEEEN